MRNTTLKSFILLSSNEMTASEFELLKVSMINVNENFMFYFANVTKIQKIEWKLVFSVKNQPQVVSSDLQFLGNRVHSLPQI